MKVDMFFGCSSTSCRNSGLDAKSSDYLILAMVIFHSRADAKITDEIIAEFKKRIKRVHELKFSKCQDNIKTMFFSYIANCNFEVRCVIIDKKKFRKNNQAANYPFQGANILYCVALLELLKSYPLKRAEIVIDGMPVIRSNLEIIKNKINKPWAKKIKEFVFKDSKESNLIQITDMIAGAVARAKLQKKKKSQHWLKQINMDKQHIKEI